MSEVQQPVQDTPAAATATTEPTTTSTTAGDKIAPASDTTAAAPTGPNAVNPVTEEKIGKNEELITSKAINEGVLNYKGTGLKGLIFSKKYFWLSDAPLEHNHLSTYLSNEKSHEIAHPNVAQATQSGKGLLFYAKRAEDKDHPQGILNIADMTDLQKGDFNDFSVKLHGKNHTFQALNKNERDGWLVALEPQMADAKIQREKLVATPGYKSALDKYSKPTTAGTTSKSRSLSRPGKASKSRERVKEATKDAPVVGATTAAPATVDSTATDTAAPTTGAVADPATGTAGKIADTPADTTTTVTPTHHHGEEAAAAGAAVGAGALGAAAHQNKEEKKAEKEEKKEEKKEDKAEKKASRSQSRGNKRSSIFSGLLGKKEDSDEKKAIKKEEKEDKKEMKAEEKAEKKEEKADKKEEKKEERAEKKEEKADKKEEEAVEKDPKHEGAGTAGGFDAAAVASRVMGEPVTGSKDHTGTSATAPTTAAEPTPAVPSDGAVDVSPTSVTPKTPATGTTSSKGNKRNSVFGGLFGKKDAPKSTASETGPAVPAKDIPAKDEGSTVASTAPQLDNPVTSPTAATPSATAEVPAGATEPALEKAAEPTAASTASPTAATATTPSDKRRTSFFSGLGTKKEKRTGATSGDELTDGEGKKSSGMGGLFRKASRAASKPAASGTTGASATKAAAPGGTATETAEKTPEKTAETKAADATEVPLPKAEPTTEGLANGTGVATSGEKSDLVPEEIGSNAIASHEKTTPVEATA